MKRTLITILFTLLIVIICVYLLLSVMLSRKRIYHGNQFTSGKKRPGPRPKVATISSIPSSSTNIPIVHTVQRHVSRSKLSITSTLHSSPPISGFLDFGYKIVDIQLLNNLLYRACVCQHCKKGQVTIKENADRRKGLSSELVTSCSECDQSFQCYSSKLVNG